ncbi:MAG TPA: cation:proton antiporter [Caldithrix abyssi]|uniref:Cation:proton antiporter n=1 Tax=Caldithrix abyssi TaxID=187145 RepID=A0A7V4WUN6_CALAY|nr:cation:proton antiporter [Caldithrix abyssi]
MRKVFAMLFLAIIGFYLFNTFALIPFGKNKMNADVAASYLNSGVQKTGAVNIVTSIVVNYRGFDTLGEVTVLFLAATGMGALLFRKKPMQRSRQNASVIVKTGARILFPLIIILGVYVFVHGHLTPGGGFQGGAIIASGFLLMFMSYRTYKVNHKVLSLFETFAGTSFVLLGLFGLIWGTSFLANILPFGEANTLFSAGIIPLIYIAVGIKVGSELTAVLDTMLKTVK